MKAILIILLVLVVLTALTYFIGGYFVEFALVPNRGAENRMLENDELDPSLQMSEEAITQIKENFYAARDARNTWLEDVQFREREINIQTHDGITLVGHAALNPVPTDKWLIALHGYQSNERESTLIAHKFFEQGYNVLTYGLRAHGKSGGQYIGMGYLDKEDLVSWTNALVEKYPNSRIFYHGTSMGGATVLFSSGLDLPENVKGIISDCAYTSIWDMFSNELKKRFNFPDFPILYMAQAMAIFKAGYNIRAGNVLEYVQKSSLPILFIHSKTDDFIPVEMAYELYDAKKIGDKSLYITDEGAHAEAKYAEPVRYYNRVLAFAEEYI